MNIRFQVQSRNVINDLNCLPDEIVLEILSKLPVKTLIICSSTCKWLLYFIDKPSFMLTHLEKTAEKNPLIFLKYYTKSIEKNYYSLEFNNDSFNGDFNLIDMPIKCCECLSNNWLDVVGCCNGVICLTNNKYCKCRFSNNVYLWNPSIRKYFVLPRPVEYDAAVIYGLGLGLGFDSRNNDFKVVRLVYRIDPVTSFLKGPYGVDVYSLRLNVWRVVECSSPQYLFSLSGYPRCLVNGALHWLGWSDFPKSVISAFNLEDEVFGEIKMAVGLVDDAGKTMQIVGVDTCWDKLALIVMSSGGNVCSVWVMKEYGVVESWGVVCRLDIPNRCSQPVAFGFMKGEEILVFVSTEESNLESRHLMLLVGRNGHVTKVLGMFDAKTCSLYVDTYVESLALFREGKTVLGNEVEGNGSLSGEADTSLGGETTVQN